MGVQPELLHQVVAHASPFQEQRYLIQDVGGYEGHYSTILHVAEQGDLVAEAILEWVVRSRDDHVGGDANRAQGGHGMLRGFRLQFSRGADVGHPRDVNEEHILAAHFIAQLTERLQERLRLDVAHCAADLDQNDVCTGLFRHQADSALDFIGDVRDHLNCAAQEVASPFLGDYLGVDLAAREVAGHA